MATQRELRVLVATDGSRGAQAAVATTMHFPWPARTRVRCARRSGHAVIASAEEGERWLYCCLDVAFAEY